MKTLTYSLSLVLIAVGSLTDVQGHDKIVACPVDAFAFYRPGRDKYDISYLDASLCTHGFYYLADMNDNNWQIYSYDPWYDLAPEDCDPGYCNYDSYRRFVHLKSENPTFVPMLSIGDGTSKYTEMSNDPAKRSIFIHSTIDHLQMYGFEGLHLTMRVQNKTSFSALVKEFHMAYEPYGLVLAVSLWHEDELYNVPEIFESVDFGVIMAYGYISSREYTRHNAPLYGPAQEQSPSHPGYHQSAYDTTEHFLSLGAPASKLVLGIPSHGRGFEMTNSEDHGLFCPADGFMPGDPYSRSSIGFWGYNAVLEALFNDTLTTLPEATPHNWTVVVDGCYKAPYMLNGPYWLGYDDVDSVSYKAQYVNFRGLAGAMISAADLDDFNGYNSPGRYPLLQGINGAFDAGDLYDPAGQGDCDTAPA